MKTQTIPLTLHMPASIHEKLCDLAKIANRTPERMALLFVELNIPQAHEDRDLDFLLPYISYESRQEAEAVAKAANDFENRPHNSYSAVPEEGGKFCVERQMKPSNIRFFPIPLSPRVAAKPTG
jgi:hypothetical protein